MGDLSQPGDPRLPYHSKWLSATCCSAALALLAVPFVAAFVLDMGMHFRQILRIIAFLMAGALFVLGRRLWPKDARATLASDKRPPILYVRSFLDDATQDPGVLERLASDYLSQTYEERLVGLLSGLGPVVAIGKPGEKLQTLGAARWYVHDDDWKDDIRTIMNSAQLVVIRAGSTGGLQWEVEQAARIVPRKNLLFFFHRHTDVYLDVWRTEYQAFREQIQELIRGVWPEQLGDSSFIGFDAAGVPYLLNPSFRFGNGEPAASLNRYAKRRKRSDYSRPITKRGRSGTWLRRNRVALGIACIAVAAMIGLGTAFVKGPFVACVGAPFYLPLIGGAVGSIIDSKDQYRGTEHNICVGVLFGLVIGIALPLIVAFVLLT